MLRSIDLSRVGMLRLGQTLEVTANNIANANTAGFKAVRAALESGDVPPPQEIDQAAGIATPPLSANVVTARVFTQGNLNATGSATDLAIDGDGFFIVNTPNGEAYTRNGQFRADAQGRLVDTSGNLVQPGLTVPAQTKELRVGEDGTVVAVSGNGQLVPAGRLQLARFANPAGLQASADGLFTATAASGPVTLATPGQNGAGKVATGMLEASNTDMTEQLSSMVAAHRTYQMNTSAFRTADEMLRLAGEISRG